MWYLLLIQQWVLCLHVSHTPCFIICPVLLISNLSFVPCSTTGSKGTQPSPGEALPDLRSVPWTRLDWYLPPLTDLVPWSPSHIHRPFTYQAHHRLCCSFHTLSHLANKLILDELGPPFRFFLLCHTGLGSTYDCHCDGPQDQTPRPAS